MYRITKQTLSNICTPYCSIYNVISWTDSIDKDDSWESNRSSPRWEILPPYMEYDGSLLFSQESATFPCPVPDVSSPCIHILPSMPVFSKCSRSFRFSHHSYWVGNTNHAVLHYAIFSSLLILPFISQISCSVSSAWKPSTLAPPLMWETKFYNHVQQAF